MLVQGIAWRRTCSLGDRSVGGVRQGRTVTAVEIGRDEDSGGVPMIRTEDVSPPAWLPIRTAGGEVLLQVRAYVASAPHSKRSAPRSFLEVAA